MHICGVTMVQHTLTNVVVQWGETLGRGRVRLILPSHKHIEQVIVGYTPLLQCTCK